MRKFAAKITVYLLLFLGIIALGILLPPTNTNNILFSLQDKHKLIDSLQKRYSDTPVMYWVGGSNVNFGIDSKLISDSLRLPCVNTAVHGGLGLKFELNNALRYARKGDVVVLMPEYENFWDFNNEMADGQCELLHTIMDVYPEGKKLIELKQWNKMLMYLPRYLHDKYVQYLPTNYRKRNRTDLGAYTRHNFNAYGDAILHLDKAPVPFLAMPTLGAPINKEILTFLTEKTRQFRARGIHFHILFPGYQQSSYQHNEAAIRELYRQFKSAGLPVRGTPERYVFADSLFYDTYYHLNRQAREIRSIFVVQDLKNGVAEDK